MLDLVPPIVAFVFMALSLSFAYCAQGSRAARQERAIFSVLSVAFLGLGVALLWI